MKALMGKKGGFRTKKMLWQALADAINEEFGSDISPLQVENKWKTLERAYKRTKERNSSSGHSRVTFEFEEELAGVLEKQHHITPTILLAPGRVIEPRNCSTLSETSTGEQSTSHDVDQIASPHQDPSPPHVTEEVPPQRGQSFPKSGKRTKEKNNVETLIQLLAEAKKDRAERAEKKLALLERLVAAVEGQAPKSSE
ncbi:hypothetical protein V5799_034227 [Amblyomma americanum]|uniref:Myb/SANT-like DNA-binding domain-containing protein n=1 Tax=Amblyomma americanum TaxID=6943 RepID=A0AAQ4DL20_AMBAM